MELSNSVIEKCRPSSDCSSMSESSSLSVENTLLSNTVMVLDILENAVHKGAISSQFATCTFEAWARKRFEQMEQKDTGEATESDQYNMNSQRGGSASTNPHTVFTSDGEHSLTRLLSVQTTITESHHRNPGYSVDFQETKIQTVPLDKKTGKLVRRSSYRERLSRLFACGAHIHNETTKVTTPRIFSFSLPRLGSVFTMNDSSQRQNVKSKTLCKSVGASISSTESDYMLYDTSLSTSACSSFHFSQPPINEEPSRKLPSVPSEAPRNGKPSINKQENVDDYEDLDVLFPQQTVYSAPASPLDIHSLKIPSSFV